MKTVSMMEFRSAAKQIIEQIRKGQTLLLTYRGRPVAWLKPAGPDRLDEEDPFYGLARLADAKGTTLTNRQIDESVYGR